jgi:hypothetical protein
LDIYHVWCNLKPGVSDIDFVEKTHQYLGQLEAQGRLVRHRITRAKLGLVPAVLREFHIMLEFEGLAQLDTAFAAAATRADPIESFHHAVNSLVTDPLFALYRDFPDSVRERGQERF